jgi:hypothetical protein
MARVRDHSPDCAGNRAKAGRPLTPSPAMSRFCNGAPGWLHLRWDWLLNYSSPAPPVDVFAKQSADI